MALTVWEKVYAMVGNPDYGVCFSVWPWPDSGWMAGVVVTDLDWATEQNLPKKLLATGEHHDVTWDIFDGFVGGINVHFASDNPEDAINKLYDTVTS